MDIKQQLIAGIGEAINTEIGAGADFDEGLSHAIDLINTLIPDGMVMVPTSAIKAAYLEGIEDDRALSFERDPEAHWEDSDALAMLANQGEGNE